MINTKEKSIPVTRGIPIAGSAFSLMKDPVAFFVKQYHEKGSIYRVKAFNKSFVVTSGVEANEFMQKKGNDHFSTLESWNSFKEAFDAKRYIVCDGEEHFKIRKIMRRGFSPVMMKNRVDEVVDYTKYLLNLHMNDQNIGGVRFMQQMIAGQMGNLMSNTYPNDYFDDILFFTRSLMNMGTSRWPKVVTKLPKYKKVRKRSIELAEKIIADHRNPIDHNREPDLIDDLLAANEGDEAFFSENDLLLSALSPFMSGIETVASSLAFVLYDLLKYPIVLKEVKEEVDLVFAEGIESIEDIRKFKKLFAVIMESMRVHSIGVAQIRTTSTPFDFKGYRVEKGETVYNAFTVTHFLDEHFRNPYDFNFHRFLNIKKGHIQPFTFAPFGLGAHACPGSKLSDVLIIIIIASMIRFVEFEPLCQSYRLKIDTDPVPSPDKKFTFKINKMRNV